MRRGVWLCLLFPAILLVSAALAWSAPPVIQNVWVVRGRHVDIGGSVEWYETVWVWVHDEDGADDIRSVAITDSEGNAHVIQPGTDSEAWVEEDATTVRVIWEQWSTPSPPPPGPYGVIAEDSAGGTDSLVTAPAPEVSPLSPVLLYPIPENSLIYETVPTFSWTGGVPGACDVLDIMDIWEETSLWSYEAGASTSVPYNADGTAAQSALTPGHSYLWVVHGFSCDDPGVTDPRVRISTSQNTYGRFTVYSPSPAVVSMGVYRGRDTSPEGAVMYHEQVWGLVSDADGWADIASATVTDTRNQEHAASLGQVDSNTGSFYWTAWGEENAPPPGVYTVTVTDTEGHSDMASAEPSAIPEETPVILSPPADNSLASSVPTFSWSGSSGWPYSLCLHEVGQCPIWSREGGESLFSVVYNDDGKAAQPELTPGHVYEWFVTASVPDVEQSDPRVWSTFNSSANGRFTVYSPIPSIRNVYIQRGRDVNAEGVVSYHEDVEVSVTDHDGAADIASVIITDTEGEAHPLGPGSAPNGSWGEEDTLTVLANWWDWGTASPPPPGPYSITVVDQVGNSDYLTTASAPQVLEVSPVLLNPPPNNSLIYETVPTFSWAESVPGDPHYIYVYDATTEEFIWVTGVVGSTSAVYNFDGGATQPELIPGHIYSWFVYSCYYDDDGVTDPRVTIATQPYSWGRFTVGPSTPVVPGSNVTTSVDGCDLTFAEVTVGGAVYGQSGPELPSGDPAGYPVAAYGWDISTTAVTEGTITVTVHYDDMFIPDGQEASLQLVRWDGSHWVDITVARDPVNNTLTGECASLGRVAIWLPYPTLPELPGKLSYNTYNTTQGNPIGTLLYSSDPTARISIPLPAWAADAEWSPDGTSMVYISGGYYPDYTFAISHLDESPPQQIPGIQGYGARWAPDGTRIVYVHRIEDGTFQIRTARTDGSEDRAVVSTNSNALAYWSPDGAWISYSAWPHPGEDQGQYKVRPDGTDPTPILASGIIGYPDWRVNAMNNAAWSPDGGRLAVWFTAQQPDSSWAAGVGVIASDGGALTPVFLVPPSWPCCLHCCGNPSRPRWSPDGTKVVVSSSHHLAAQVPSGQLEPGTEVWMMDADGSGQPVRLTYNDTYDESISWWAPNTEPGSDVEIVKGDTTVTFADVTETGDTSVTVSNDPPAPEPQGFTFLGDYWEVTTTAQLAEGSKITLAIHYDDADVPAGQEEWLSLLHWEDGYWVDITVRPIDTVNNIITGECYSLSEFGIALGPQFQGLLQPINNDGSSIFKLNRTVPVKFQLVAPDGSYVSDAVARLYLAKVSNQVVGSYQEPESTSAADSGNTFRYDAQADQYIFNLGTKGLSIGTWALQVTVNGLVAKEVWISLR